MRITTPQPHSATIVMRLAMAAMGATRASANSAVKAMKWSRVRALSRAQGQNSAFPLTPKPAPLLALNSKPDILPTVTAFHVLTSNS